MAGEKDKKYRSVGYLVTTTFAVYCIPLFMLAFSIHNFVALSQRLTNELEVKGITQIIDDWNVPFITEIYVQDAPKPKAKPTKITDNTPNSNDDENQPNANENETTPPVVKQGENGENEIDGNTTPLVVDNGETVDNGNEIENPIVNNENGDDITMLVDKEEENQAFVQCDDGKGNVGKELFHYDWYGLRGGYYGKVEAGENQEHKLFETDCYGNDCGAETERKEVLNFPLVESHIFNGKHICANQQKTPENQQPGNMGVILPVYNKECDTWNCPEDYFLCGDKGHSDVKCPNGLQTKNIGDHTKQTCVFKPKELRKKLEMIDSGYTSVQLRADMQKHYCPITDIKFVTIPEGEEFTEEEGYTYVDFNKKEGSPTTKIGYSKTKFSGTNTRPLTQFRVSQDAPCIDDTMPNSYDTSKDSVVYKIFQTNEFMNPNQDFDKSPHRSEGGCLFDKNSYSFKDTKRFIDLAKDVDLGITMKSLQDENGITEIKNQMVGRTVQDKEIYDNQLVKKEACKKGECLSNETEEQCKKTQEKSLQQEIDKGECFERAFDYEEKAALADIKIKFWARQTLMYDEFNTEKCKMTKKDMVSQLDDLENLLIKSNGGKSDIQKHADVAEYLARYYLVILVLSLIYIVLANDIHGKEREYYQRLLPQAVAVVIFFILTIVNLWIYEHDLVKIENIVTKKLDKIGGCLDDQSSIDQTDFKKQFSMLYVSNSSAQRLIVIGLIFGIFPFGITLAWNRYQKSQVREGEDLEGGSEENYKRPLL